VAEGAPERLAEVLERARRPLDRLRTVRVVLTGRSSDPEPRELECRLWYAAPDRIRCASRVGSFSHLVVSDGCRRWWSYDPTEMRVDDENGEYERAARLAARIVDASGLLPVLDVDRVDDATHLGRSAYVLDGRVRSASADTVLEEDLEDAERVVLTVDRESGLLLGKEVWSDDRLVRRQEVVELAMDEPIPPERFVYEPEPGIRLRDHGELEREFQSLPTALKESARVVPFEVFVLGREAKGWQLEEARPSLRDDESEHGRHLTLDYSRLGDADFELDRLWIWEWALEDGEPLADEIRIERGAGPFVVVAIGEPGTPSSVLATIRRTKVQLFSLSIGEDELVTLARTLRPLRRRKQA
jgi:outer membrane lipoprotein-sorting protein